MNCASTPTLKLWRPRIHEKLSSTCQIPWLKSKPASLTAAIGPPKLATPATVIAGPVPAPSLAVRNWWRRAYWTRSSFRRSEPMEEISCTEAESIRSLKSVACSTVFDAPRMLAAML